MDPWNYEGELSRDTLVRWCCEDRDQLREEFFILRPDNEGLPPALWVEELIEALRLKIAYKPMGARQLGLCDNICGHIYVNSRLQSQRRADNDVDRRSTLTHELAHTRLHGREMRGQAFVHYDGHDDGFENPRSPQREFEVGIYEALFLMTRSDLESHEISLPLLESRGHEEEIESEKLWEAMGALAKAFYVSPEAMVKSWLDLRWLKKRFPSTMKGRPYDLKLSWR